MTKAKTTAREVKAHAAHTLHHTETPEHEFPTVGRIVHYIVSAADAERATAARAHDGTTGAPIITGSHYPAITVGVEGYGVNLRVFLDGPDDLYVDHVQYADEDEVDEAGAPLAGRWHWPEQA